LFGLYITAQQQTTPFSPLSSAKTHIFS